MNPLLCKKNYSLKNQDLLAFLCLALTLVFLLWKAPYSYGLAEDESVMFTFAHRLALGDSPLTDEWNKSQIFGILIYLPLKLYVYFAGSTEGLLLFFRYLFVAFHVSVSVVLYSILRKHGIISIFATLINCLHIPFIFILMSYNTVGFAFMLLTGAMLATTKEQSPHKFFIIGVLFACAVLCNPTLAVLYFFYSTLMLFFEIGRSKKHRFFQFSEISFSIKSWFWISLGISTIASIFIVFLFSRTSFREITETLPMLLTDPKLGLSQADDIAKETISIRESLLTVLGFSPYLFAAYGILMTTIVFDKKRIAHRSFYLTVVFVIYLLFMRRIVLSPFLPDQGIFLWMLPLSLLGLTCYSLSAVRDRSAFAFLWIFGLLYAIILWFSSNVANLTSPYALGISDIASVIFIKNIGEEIKCQKQKGNPYYHNNQRKDTKWLPAKRFKKRVVLTLLIFVLLIQIGSELYINAALNRYSSEYFFTVVCPATEKLNATIQVGPLKGIITTANTKRLYGEMINDLDWIKENGEGPSLIAGGFYPWCYLHLNMPYATYSAEILNYIDNNRLKSYYKLHPERLPKYIYVTKLGKITIENMPEGLNKVFMYGDAKDIVADISKNYNCSVKESDVGYVVEVISLF